MTWVRSEDSFPIHRKVAPLDDATYRLHSEAIHWCARNLTDGLIAADELSTVSKRATPARAQKLVDRVLWHPAGFECRSTKCPPTGPDGWVIHDYLDYQPSREKVRAEQAAKAERQRRWIDAHKGGSRDASHRPSRDAPEDAPPSPPRPAPKEAGAGPPSGLPAANGGRAAAGSQPKSTQPCPTCGNATTSAYHRNACRPEVA